MGKSCYWKSTRWIKKNTILRAFATVFIYEYQMGEILIEKKNVAMSADCYQALSY